MKFDWRHYISEQLHLADCLFTRGDEIVGADPNNLYLIAQSRLSDVSRLTGTLISDE